jgi:hypothetical protein
VAESKPAVEITHPLRRAARLTGLSPELLRAWERRREVVELAELKRGAAGARDIELPDAVERIESLEDFEQRIVLLGCESADAR